MKLRTVALFILLLTVPAVSFGAMDFDLRVKAGTAAGADKITFEPFPDVLSGSGNASRNFQIEFNFLPLSESMVTPVLSIGLFDRRHSGTVYDPFFDIPPTEVDYNVSGLTFGAGVRIRASRELHFEGKIELAGGQGEPTLSTPGFIWHPVLKDGYGATSVIFGGYYTVSEPGLQLGLEIGAQSFIGDFKIWDDDGFWMIPRTEGSGGIVNFIVGFRF